ncbi:DUF4397 domain-containing protein [Sediminibacterium sp.]|uniref:DUF4397 domain-containing protein n=1 Tax=Sediminibacterium sp. TaxID=1917865 RepID=UPI0025CC7EC6|nr:DUF4397 domain-containing protein [Sediminibacterium sp.]
MKMKLFSIIAVIGLFTACKKDFDGRATESVGTENKAFIRIVPGSVGALRNFATLDGALLNGTALSMGSVFPGASTVTAFATILPGARTIRVYDSSLVPAQTPVSISATFDAGKFYTVYTYDTSNAVKALIQNDVFTVPSDTTANVKFVNIIFSSSAVPNVDLYSRRKRANIATNIAPLSSSNYIPHITGLTDTLEVRATGTTAPLAIVNGFTFNQKRTYNVVFRGRYQSTSGTMSRGITVMATY